MSLFGGFAKPFRGTSEVLCRSLSAFRQNAEAELSFGLTLLRRQFEPSAGVLEILRNALAVRVCKSKLTLRFAVTSFGGLDKFGARWRTLFFEKAVE